MERFNERAIWVAACGILIVCNLLLRADLGNTQHDLRMAIERERTLNRMLDVMIDKDNR
jgi:hypothetical protein